MGNQKWNCALAIISYNRPEYLQQCLDAWSKSSNTFSAFLFCDGGAESSIDENKKIASKYKFLSDVILQDQHIGIARHIYYAKKMLFETFLFDRVIVFEEDVIPSPHYYNHVNYCMDWCLKHNNLVKMVNTNFICKLSYEEKINSLNVITNNYSSLCNYLIPKETWLLTREFIEEYIDKFILPGIPYKERPQENIKRWIQKNIDNSPNYHRNAPYGSAQDTITSIALNLHGYHYASSIVNRALYIGRNGMHCTESWFKRMELDKVTLDVFPYDETSQEFIYV